MPVQSLTSIEELNEMVATSNEKHVFLFKHSTRCPISVEADRQYSLFVSENDDRDDVVFTHLDLLNHRDVSNAIAEKLSIQHQSPQAILLVRGAGVWNASHGNINQTTLSEALARVETCDSV